MCAQLLVFCRYKFNGYIKEDFLLRENLETSTKAADKIKTISKFFDKHELDWNNVVGVTTDGVPAMLWCKVLDSKPWLKVWHLMLLVHTALFIEKHWHQRLYLQY